MNHRSPQILTTPTKPYNLRSRLAPLSSPEHLNGSEDGGEDIWCEQPPSDMTEMALTEELRQVQVRMCEIFGKCEPNREKKKKKDVKSASDFFSGASQQGADTAE